MSSLSFDKLFMSCTDFFIVACPISHYTPVVKFLLFPYLENYGILGTKTAFIDRKKILKNWNGSIECKEGK